jgi:microcystin-dependent protein
MADLAPKDFSTTAASNATVGGINIAEGSTAAQLNDALRAVLAVLANPDFGVGTLFKVDNIAESTADEGVTVDGLLIKDGAIPSITTEIAASIPVGTQRETFRSTPDTGWLMMDGDTLGSAASAATQASDDHEDLFVHLWTYVSDTYAAVSSGRGASAAADWTANKTIVIPNRRDRVGIGAGSAYAAGETGGAATVALTQAQLPTARLFTAANVELNVTNSSLPTVNSTNQMAKMNDSGASRSYGLAGSATEATVSRTSPMGSGEAHDNLPPYTGVYHQIKY